MLRPKKSVRDATVYAEPYWFDEAKSLVELGGVSSEQSTRAELASPVGSLSLVQIESLLRAKTGSHYLAPIAIARLRGELGANEKALVRTLVELGDFWSTHPYLRAQLEQILQAHVARSNDDELRAHAAHFLQMA